MHRHKKTVLYLGIIIVSWILILAVPSFRDIFLAQSVRGGDILPAAIPSGKPDFVKLAKGYPHDLALQISRIDVESQQLEKYHAEKSFSKSFDIGITPQAPSITKETLQKRYAQLPEQFTDSALAVFYYLNHTLRAMNSIRLAGPLYDPYLQEHKKKGIPSPEREGERNYTHQQWLHVIAMCKRGQKLVPQNGYFYVIEAYWQFAEFHDVAGWKAVERALSKPTINTYILATRQARLKAFRFGYGRSMAWEEVLADPLYNTHVVFNFPVKMRQMVRWMVWQGMQAQKRGDHKTALKRYGATFRLANFWYRSAETAITMLSANGCENLALTGPRSAGTKPAKTAKRGEMTASAFDIYALANHRSDLAKYAQIQKTHRHETSTLVHTMTRVQKNYFIPAFLGFALWRLGVLLLWFFVGAVILGGLMVAISKVLIKKEIDSSPLREYDYWRGAISFAALPASLILILGYALSLYVNPYHRTYDMYTDFAMLHILTNSFAPYILLVIAGILTPIIFGLGYCLRRAAKDNQKAGAPKVLIGARIISAIGSLFFVIFWAALGSAKWSFPANKHWIHANVLSLLSGRSPDSPYSNDWKYVVGFAAIMVILGIVIYLFNTVRLCKNVEDKSTYIMGASTLIRGSTLRWLALASVVYLLTLAIAIPVRAPLHERAMIKVAHGELAVLKMDR